MKQTAKGTGAGRPWRAALLCAAAGLMMTLGAGCTWMTGPPSGVRVESRKTDKRYKGDFPVALVTRGSGGDYHVVLLNDGARKAYHVEPGNPLPPLDLSPVRQVMEIHVFWKPMRGAKPDNPSATNAAIDWYLVRADTGSVTGLAHYEGAGLIDVEIGGDAATITIYSAALKPKTVQGDITDPLGPVQIVGRFDADHKPAAVTDVLAQLEKLKKDGVGAEIDPVKLTQPASAGLLAD